MSRIRTIEKHTESKLYQRLKASDSDAQVRDLIAAIDKVTSSAITVSTLIIRHMPQYTLHNERHFLNVLALMDALIADRSLDQMMPLECALCIMAAYVHDLGMACSSARLARITDPETEDGRAFAIYCEQYHHELLHQKKRLSQGTPQELTKAQIIHDYMMAEFLRGRHFDDPGPVRDWLLEIIRSCGNNRLFYYGDYDYLDDLARIAASHGHSVDWLRVQFDPRREGDFLTSVRTGEGPINRAFPSLVLRLADLMDFDASRAPSILFHHIAIENKVSVDEWQKHMAISAVHLDGDHGEPVFSITAQCPSPVIQKNILTFASMIERELSTVRGELSSQRHFDNRYDILLPTSVDCRKVKPSKSKTTGQPLYYYEDLDFRLNQEEIMNLLMGENLYDQPWICIRELLQNAMDALELREMRLKLDEECGEPGRHADPLARDEELQVWLRWGYDALLDQEWLEVEDNGIGMTLDVVRNYFTQIGKSFYRSPGYIAERKQFEDHKLPPTSPTSQFGIGILSCFMLADRLDVSTHPGRYAEPHYDTQGNVAYPLEIQISGPGSLFWITPPGKNSRRKQGTRIRLYLKKKYKIKHDAVHLLDRLRSEFGYSNSHYNDYPPPPLNEQPFDPVRVALRHCVWPKYPLQIVPPSGQGKSIIAREDGNGPSVFDSNAEIITGASFHGTVLLQPLLNVEAMRKVAMDLGFPPESVGNPHWVWWDVVDDESENGSGSRFRLWYLRHDDRYGHQAPVLENADRALLLSLSQLAVIAMSNLLVPHDLDLVSGMYVREIKMLMPLWEAVGNISCRIWKDWRGEAMPRLKADRSEAKWPAHIGLMKAACQNLFTCAAGTLAAQCQSAANDFTSVCRTLVAWHKKHRHLFGGKPFEMKRLIANPAIDGPIQLRSLSCDTYRIGLYHHDSVRALFRDVDISFAQNLTYKLNQTQDIDYSSIRNSARDFAQNLARIHPPRLSYDPIKELTQELFRDFYNDYSQTRDLFQARAKKLAPWAVALRLHCLSEALQPALEDSLPQLGCFGLCGHAGNLRLLGPAVIGHNPAIPGNFSDPQVVFNEATPWLPKQLVEAEYDLVFPISAIPLGALRRCSPLWREDRRLRPLATYVFHDPEAAKWFTKKSFNSIQLCQAFHVEQILALLPHERFYSKTWDEWTTEDWSNPGLSALWDIREGWVKWVWGVASAHEIRKRGVALDELPNSLNRMIDN